MKLSFRVIHSFYLLIVVLNSLYGEASTFNLTLHGEAAILMDVQSGRILYQYRSDKDHVPASLTKIPSLLLAYQAIDAGHLTYDTPITISERAAVYNQPPRSSRMGLEPGQRLVLKDLMLGMAIASGNDAAVAMAEAVSGSVEDFVQQMNSLSQQLGATSTIFVDPAGIMDGNRTTAADLALIMRHYLLHYPHALRELHSVPSFHYPSLQQMNHQGTIRYTLQHTNPIKLIRTYPGADGLKTGYLSTAGYNLAATATKDSMRVLAIILGVQAPGVQTGSRLREGDAANLFTYAFDNYAYYPVITHPLYDSVIQQKVHGGYHRRVSIALADEQALVRYPLTQAEWQDSQLHVYMDKKHAPIKVGEVVGRVELISADITYTEPIIAKDQVDRLPFWLALNDRLNTLFTQLFFRR